MHRADTFVLSRVTQARRSCSETRLNGVSERNWKPVGLYTHITLKLSNLQKRVTRQPAQALIPLTVDNATPTYGYLTDDAHIVCFLLTHLTTANRLASPTVLFFNRLWIEDNSTTPGGCSEGGLDGTNLTNITLVPAI